MTTADVPLPDDSAPATRGELREVKREVNTLRETTRNEADELRGEVSV